VKAYVKRNKNDAADAEAICEAVTRPTMRFVPIKSAEAQSVLMLHRARHLLVRQRTAQVSAMRAHLAEYGFIAAKGISRLRDLLPLLEDGAGMLPELARQTLLLIAQLIEALTIQNRKIETELLRWHRGNASSQRLETIPASASSRQRRWPPRYMTRALSGPDDSSPPGSAWCRARTPAAARSGSAGSPRWATAICGTCSSSAGPRSSAIPAARRPSISLWASQLLERKPARLVTVAVANKMAR